MGYLVAVTLQWITVTCVSLLTSILTSCGIAFYLYAIAVTKDIKCALNTIDKSSKTKTKDKQMNMQFADFIDLYSTMKQLSCVSFLEQMEIICFLLW